MKHAAQSLEVFVRGVMKGSIDPDQVGRQVVCVLRCRWRVVEGWMTIPPSCKATDQSPIRAAKGSPD